MDTITILDPVRLPDGTTGQVSQWEGNGIAKVYMGPSKYNGSPHYRYVPKSELIKITD